MQKASLSLYLFLGFACLILSCGGPTKSTPSCEPNCSDAAICPVGGCVDTSSSPEDIGSTDLDVAVSQDEGASDSGVDLDQGSSLDTVMDQGEITVEDLGQDVSEDLDLPATQDSGATVDVALGDDGSSDPLDTGTEEDSSSVADPGTIVPDVTSATDLGSDFGSEPDLTPPPGCASSDECPGFQSCSLASVCVSAQICLSHDDCVDGSCIEGECSDNEPVCTDGTYCDSGGYCDPVLHACVDHTPCSQNADCLTNYCNATIGTCFQCVGASDCPDDAPLCNDGTCIFLGACTKDSNCSPGEICQPGGICGVPLPLSDVFDTTGSNDTPAEAVTVNAGSFPNLTIHPTDPDYYKIDIPPGKSLRVAVRGSNPDARIQGRLIDLDTDFILDERENLTYFTVLYAPAQSISRQVRLELTNPSGSVGIYELEVRLESQSPCLNDKYDLTGSNDTLGNAELIPDPHTLLIGASICSEDKDWYKIEMETNEELIVWFWREQGSDAPTVLLRDELGAPVNFGEVLGDHTLMREDTLPAGTYYLSIVPNNDEQELRYNLQIDRWSKQLCSTDTHEVDDIPWLGLQKPLTGAALTLCAGDVDYFPAHTEPDEGLEVVVSYNNSFSKILVTVTDLDTGEVAAEIDSPLGPVGAKVLSAEITAETFARDFLIKTERISTSFAGGTGYTLSATPIAQLCVDDSYEPNGDVSTATTLSAGGPIVQLVDAQICSTDGADWYSVSLSPGALLGVDLLTDSDGLASVNMNLWKDVAGELVSAGTPTLSPLGLGLTATVALEEGESSQNIYVEVQSTETHPYVLYPFVVSSTACIDGAEEPDNTPLTSREFNPGSTVSGDLCMGNPDILRIEWDGSATVNPAITGTNSGSVMKIYMTVRNSEMQGIASPKLQAMGPEASTDLDLIGMDLPPGTYFIELTSLFAVDYSFSW